MNISDNLLNSKNIVGEDSSIFTKKHYISLVSCLIIWLSGVLFILKSFDDAVLKIILYSIIFAIVLTFIDRTEKYYKSFLTKNHLFLILLILTAAAILLYRLEYIGYPSIGGFTILWLIIIYYSQNVKVSLIQLVVFVFSPVFYSELISFSGILVVSMLVVLSIFMSERYLDNKKLDWKFFLIAFLFGVTLAVHLLVWLVYIIYLVYRFKSESRNGLVFILVMLGVYLLLLFLGDNGYVKISGSQIDYVQFTPVWIFILLIIASLYIGWIITDFQEVLFSSGLVYFILFTMAFLLKITQWGWNKEWIDLSLMIFAVPFLVLSIKEYKVDRFLGKIL